MQRKLPGAPKNLGLDTFPDPVGHFGPPWRPFWAPLAAILNFWGSQRRNDQFKKLIYQKLCRSSNNLRFDLFPDPVSHFRLSERVPPLPQGWYSSQQSSSEKVVNCPQAEKMSSKSGNFQQNVSKRHYHRYHHYHRYQLFPGLPRKNTLKNSIRDHDWEKVDSKFWNELRLRRDCLTVLCPRQDLTWKLWTRLRVLGFVFLRPRQELTFNEEKLHIQIRPFLHC